MKVVMFSVVLFFFTRRCFHYFVHTIYVNKGRLSNRNTTLTTSPNMTVKLN